MDKEEYNFEFEILLKKVHLNILDSSKYIVGIKGDSFSVQTKQRLPVNPQSKEIEYNEILKMNAILIKSSITKSYSEEKVNFKNVFVNLFGRKEEGNYKVVGESRINLSDFVEKPFGISTHLKIYSCPDQNAFYDMVIRCSRFKKLNKNKMNDFVGLKNEIKELYFESPKKFENLSLSKEKSSTPQIGLKGNGTEINSSSKYQDFTSIHNTTVVNAKTNFSNFNTNPDKNLNISLYSKDKYSTVPSRFLYNNDDKKVSKDYIDSKDEEKKEIQDSFNSHKYTLNKIPLMNSFSFDSNGKDIIINNLRKQNSQLEKDINELNESLYKEKNNFVKELSLLKENIKRLESQNKSTETKLSNYKNKLKLLMKNPTNLEDKMPNLDPENNSQIKILEKQLQEYKSLIESLNSNLKIKDEQIEKLNNEIVKQSSKDLNTDIHVKLNSFHLKVLKIMIKYLNLIMII